MRSGIKYIRFQALCAAVVLAGAACGGASKDFQLLRSEVFSLQQDQRQMQHQITVLDSLIRQRTTGMGQFTANFDADIRQLKERVAIFDQRISDNEKRVSRMQSLETAKPATVSPGQAGVPAASAGSADPREIFNLAYKDFTSSSYDMAIEGFRDFLTRYPDVPLATEAYLYIGDSYRAQKKYNEAISSYSKIVERFADSQLHPDALYKIGDCLISSGQKARGETYLQQLIQKFPDSEAAALARARLNP
jgi:tol-pal system protein YbgF